MVATTRRVLEFVEARNGRLLMVGAGNPPARLVLSPEEGEKVWYGGLGVRFMIGGAQTGGNFVLAERHGLVVGEPPA